MRYRRIRPGVGDPAGETREVGVRGGIVSQRLQRHEPALEIPENEVSGGASRTRGADNAAGGKNVDARREERLREYLQGGLDGVVDGVAAARLAAPVQTLQAPERAERARAAWGYTPLCLRSEAHMSDLPSLMRTPYA